MVDRRDPTVDLRTMYVIQQEQEHSVHKMVTRSRDFWTGTPTKTASKQGKKHNRGLPALRTAVNHPFVSVACTHNS